MCAAYSMWAGLDVQGRPRPLLSGCRNGLAGTPGAAHFPNNQFAQGGKRAKSGDSIAQRAEKVQLTVSRGLTYSARGFPSS